jgi:hypothetical protein
VLAARTPDLIGGVNNASREAAMAVPVPCAISARFARPGEWRHFYRIDGRTKGQRLAIRARTRTIGLPCDVLLRLASLDGERTVTVAESKPGPGDDDDVLEAKLPAEGSYLLSVEELNRRTGPSAAYRLEIEHGGGGPGYALTAETDRVEVTKGGTFHLKIKCARRGYDGSIALALHSAGGGQIEVKETSGVLAAGKTEADIEAKLPPETKAISLTVTGSAQINGQDFTARATTAPILRKLFPRLPNIPGGLDGQIGAAVRE